MDKFALEALACDLKAAFKIRAVALAKADDITDASLTSILPNLKLDRVQEDLKALRPVVRSAKGAHAVILGFKSGGGGSYPVPLKLRRLKKSLI